MIIALAATPAPTSAESVATWVFPVSGSWTDPAKWSTNPSYPNNGMPAGTTYSALLSATGSPYAVTLNPYGQITTDIAIADLTISSPAATLNFFNGTLSTPTINVTAGTLNMAAGARLTGSTLTAANAATVIAAGTFDSVTLAGAISMPSTSINSVNALTLQNATLSLTANVGNSGTSSAISIAGADQRLAGSGSIVFNGSNYFGNKDYPFVHPNAGTLVIDPGILIRTGNYGGTVGWTADPTANHGTISAQTNGQPVTLAGSTWLNDGTLQATDGGILNLTGSGTNAGLISVSNAGSVATTGDFTNTGSISVTNSGILTLHGNWSSPAGTITMADAQVNFGGTFTPAALAHFSRSSGAVYLDGTLDLTGTSFPLNAATGSWKLADGSKIQNGPVTASDSQGLTVVGNTELSAVTLASPVTVNYATLKLSNNTTLSNATISLAPVSSVTLQVTSPTLAGTGQIVFDTATSTSANRLIGSGAAAGLTIAPGISVRTGSGSGSVGDTSIPLVNQGTLSAQTPGQTLALFGNPLTNAGAASATNGSTLTLAAQSILNSGTLQASNNAILNISSPTSTANITNTGSIAASSGGAVTLGGKWTNAGTLSVDNATLNLAGTFSPSSIGTVTVSNGGIVNVAGSLNLASATLNLSAALPLGITTGGNISNGAIASPDSTPLPVRGLGATLTAVTLNTPASIGPNAALTFASSISNQPITAAGVTSYLNLTGAWGNNSFISLTDGATLNLGGTPTALGNISLANSSLYILNTYTAAQLRTLSISNSSLHIGSTGNLVVTGDTLTLDPSTGDLQLAGGRITGGTVSSPTGRQLLANPASSSILDGVTLAANLTLATGAAVTTLNGLTLSNNARISLTNDSVLTLSGPSPIAGAGEITFDGVAPLSPDGPSTFNGTPPRLSATTGSTSSLTISPSITVRTNTSGGTVGIPSRAILNQGAVSAQTPSKTLSVTGSSINNTGTLSATNSSTLVVTASTSFTNTGTITIDPTSTLRLVNAASNPNGPIKLSGTAVLDYPPTVASPIASVRAQLRLGLTSSGATGISHPPTTSDPNRALAYIEASTLLGLTGTQTTTWSTQTVDTTSLLLFPTLYGDSNLDGSVTPADYALLDRALALNLPATWSNGDYNYDNTIDSNDFLLIDRSYLSAQTPSPTFLASRESQFGPAYVSQLLTSIPEPTLSSILYPLSSLLLLPRRRAR